MKNILQKHSILALALALFSSSVLAGKSEQATQLLNFFSSNCSAKGTWTDVALSHSQAIISTLQSMRDDEDCAAVSGMLGNLDQVNQYINQFQQNEDQRTLVGLKQQEQTLMNALTASTNPDEILEISSELRNIQTQIANLEGYISYDQNSDYTSMAESEQLLSGILSNTSALMHTVQGSQSCWAKYPGILSSIGGLAATVASTVTSSGVALIMQAGVELISQVTVFARKWSINRQINRTLRGTTSTAFTCALERIADNWCGAEDAKAAIELKESVLTDPDDDNLWIGVRINDRDLPILIDWLKQVRAGADPSTVADADRQNRVIFREAMVRTTKRKVLAIKNEKEDLYRNAGSPQATWNVLRTIILDIRGAAMAGGGRISVFEEIYPSPFIPYYLLGFKGDEERIRSNSGYIDFESFQLQQGDDFTLEKVMAKYEEWQALAEKTVQNELNQVLQNDPLGIVNNAIDNQGLPNKITPKHAILVIKRFLEDNIPDDFSNPTNRDIYRDTVNTLQKFVKNIDEVFQYVDVEPGKDPRRKLEPSEALKNISTAAKLSFGTNFIRNRVIRSVRFALNEIVIQRRNDGDILSSQLLAAEDIIDALNRYSATGNLNLTEMKMGIHNAQSISQNTLHEFAKIFGHKIRRSLKHYDKMAKRAQEPANGPNRTSKAALCLKLLSVDKWPWKVPFKLCEGTQLHHTNANGPKSVKITKEIKELPFRKRACLYRDWLRRSLIFQNHRIIIGPSHN